MTQWEYCEAVVDIDVAFNIPGKVTIWKYKPDGKHEEIKTQYLGKVLAVLGNEGWELVSSYPVIAGQLIHNYRVTYMFKRPILAGT